MGDRALTLNVEDEILARFEDLARVTGRSSEQLAKEALKQYVEYESWKADKIGDAVRRAATAGHRAPRCYTPRGAESASAIRIRSRIDTMPTTRTPSRARCAA